MPPLSPQSSPSNDLCERPYRGSPASPAWRMNVKGQEAGFLPFTSTAPRACPAQGGCSLITCGGEVDTQGPRGTKSKLALLVAQQANESRGILWSWRGAAGVRAPAQPWGDAGEDRGVGPGGLGRLGAHRTRPWIQTWALKSGGGGGGGFSALFFLPSHSGTFARSVAAAAGSAAT